MGFSFLVHAERWRAFDARSANKFKRPNVGSDVAEPLSERVTEVDGEQLQLALNELPEVYRTPIILYYFDDFSYRDIAAQMDLPIGTVMSRLARAKAYLRTRLLQPAPAVLADGRRRATDGL